MNEDTGQERLAFIGSLVIFASLLGLVLVLLLIEYVLDGSDGKKTFQVFSSNFPFKSSAKQLSNCFPSDAYFYPKTKQLNCQKPKTFFVFQTFDLLTFEANYFDAKTFLIVDVKLCCSLITKKS